MFRIRVTRTFFVAPALLQAHTYSRFRPLDRLASISTAGTPQTTTENTNVGHARFLAEASKGEKWKSGVGNARKGGAEGTGEEAISLEPGKGKLSPTSSHLFKLILPLPASTPSSPPTVFLLHPSQPLSHVSRLITASLPHESPPPLVSFRTPASDTPPNEEITSKPDDNPDVVQWSDSTDIGDFIKSAAHSNEFSIVLIPPPSASQESNAPNETRTIQVAVPTFKDRTRFLRRRLNQISAELEEMDVLKRACDIEAHKGARRVALTGFGMLIVYWGTVARLTFWDLGWDIMEPVTYLSGLSTVICGYLWFLYQGREVSYSSVLDRSVSTRRAQLYAKRGLDVERRAELLAETKALRKEVGKIAEDYGVEYRGRDKDIQEGQGKETGGLADPEGRWRAKDQGQDEKEQEEAKAASRKAKKAAEEAERS